MLGSLHESDKGSVPQVRHLAHDELPADGARSDRPLAFDPTDEDGWHHLARGYRLAGLLLSAHRMGLLRTLADRGPLTIETLADELLIDVRLLMMVCRALRAAGLLETTNDDRWRLNPAGERLATDTGATLELDAMAEDYRRWGELDRISHGSSDVLHAESTTYAEADLAYDEHAARRYARRMANRRRQQAERLLSRVMPTRPLTVLDAWGGDGYMAREVCARWPQITCTVLEIPTMARVAREACAGQPRVAVITGDLVRDDPAALLGGETVDVVVLSHVLQSLSEQRRREVAARVTHVLAPGGCLLSSEFVLRWDDRDSLDVLLWAVGRSAAARWEGEPLRANEQDMLLRGGGLAAVDSWWVTETTRAVLGVKPAAGIEPALRIINDPAPRVTRP